MDKANCFEFNGRLYERVGWRKQYGPGTSTMRGIESRGAVLPKVESHLGLLDDMEHELKVSSDEAHLKGQKPTKAAAKFIAANAESGVVSGAAFGKGRGGNYTLADGRSFDLTLEDMRSMPMPRWDFEANGD